MEWECDAVLKDFSWGVTSHDKDGLRVRLEFEKPAELSYSAPDRVLIRVKDPGFFRSVLTDSVAMNLESLWAGYTHMEA